MKMQAHTGKKATPKKRKVSHVRISRGANGFAVHHELEPQPRPAHSMASLAPMEPDPKPNYFADKKAMLDHVGSLADQMGGDESEAAEGETPTQA